MNKNEIDEFYYIKNNELYILYPASYSEEEVQKMIEVFKIILDDNITSVFFLNKEISVKLFFYLLETITTKEIPLYLNKQVYEQYQNKLSSLTNILKLDDNLVKVYDE